MSDSAYFSTPGGLPPQTALHTGRAVFTEAYAVLPKATMSDITTSFLPGWKDTRCWIIARPLSGFAETFAHYIVEVSTDGGSDAPEPDPLAEGVIFVVGGMLELTVDGESHTLSSGGYAYLPPGAVWSAHNHGSDPVRFHWIRKEYEPAEGIDQPQAFVANESDIDPITMPDTEGRWATTRFVEPDDLRHDMHVNIVTFKPGGVIPFEETHVMEHGLYVLEGKAVYRLNRDWVEVEAGGLHVAARLLPPSLLRRWAGPFPLSALQGRESASCLADRGASMKPIPIEPLTRDAFAPFGQVLETEGADHFMINEGTTTRFHALATTETGKEGRAILSIFRGTCRGFPFAVEMLECHPLGSQAFMPLSAYDWLVVVAEQPDPESLRCFRADGSQGVQYAQGVWHHPLLVLEPEQDFLIVDRDGPGENLREVTLPRRREICV